MKPYVAFINPSDPDEGAAIYDLDIGGPIIGDTVPAPLFAADWDTWHEIIMDYAAHRDMRDRKSRLRPTLSVVTNDE